MWELAAYESYVRIICDSYVRVNYMCELYMCKLAACESFVFYVWILCENHVCEVTLFFGITWIICVKWWLHIRSFWMQSSVLQCVAVCCSVLQCVAVCRSVLQCVAVCCCCSVLQCIQYLIVLKVVQSCIGKGLLLRCHELTHGLYIGNTNEICGILTKSVKYEYNMNGICKIPKKSVKC